MAATEVERPAGEAQTLPRSAGSLGGRPAARRMTALMRASSSRGLNGFGR
jgi:hypothetical protein